MNHFFGLPVSDSGLMAQPLLRIRYGSFQLSSLSAF
jgi:hypothetical protein